MTRAELRTELLAQGFDFLSSSRANQIINDAYQELCNAEFWPFLETSASGAAPLTISDLRSVDSVIDTVQHKELEYSTKRDLRRRFVDLTTTGAPGFYYIDAGSIVRTYPVGGTLTVDYVKVPAELDDDADEPVVPERYHRLILDIAVRIACLERGDEEYLTRASSVSQSVENRLITMRENLMVNTREGDRVGRVAGSDDG